MPKNTKPPYDVVVFIGRFQPFHLAHLETVKRAFEYAPEVAIVFGSRYQPPTFKNPFQDRQEYVRAVMESIWASVPTNAESLWGDRLNFFYQRDLYSDLRWCEEVQRQVVEKFGPGARIALIGCEKDKTSFYLNMFKQWDRIYTTYERPISATNVREFYFQETPQLDFVKGAVPGHIFAYMDRMSGSEWHTNVVAERRAMEAYKTQFASLPYPPIFVTTDAVVVQSGHILLVERKSYPGKGLMALPGGFVNALGDKSLEDAMVRELREETRLKVAEKVLRGSIRGRHVFDAPDRSSRGRTITHAFKIVLDDAEDLPKVQAGSDARKAIWVPLAGVKSEQCFEDHYQIIQHFL